MKTVKLAAKWPAVLTEGIAKFRVGDYLTTDSRFREAIPLLKADREQTETEKDYFNRQTDGGQLIRGEWQSSNSHLLPDFYEAQSRLHTLDTVLNEVQAVIRSLSAILSMSNSLRKLNASTDAWLLDEGKRKLDAALAPVQTACWRIEKLIQGEPG